MNTIQERVIHHLDPSSASHIPLFLPSIRICRGGVGSGAGIDDRNSPDDDVNNVKDVDHVHLMTHSDLDRVMDYNNMPEPPMPCAVMHCEAPGSGMGIDDEDRELEVYDGGIIFPKRTAKLSGGFIFLTSCKGGGGGGDGGGGNNKVDADKEDGNGGGEVTRGKIACIPLQGCSIELPPGGRRVFREHAHTGKYKCFSGRMKYR